MIMDHVCGVIFASDGLLIRNNRDTVDDTGTKVFFPDQKYLISYQMNGYRQSVSLRSLFGS